MKDVLEITDEGDVLAPSVPGIGYEIDWDIIDNSTI